MVAMTESFAVEKSVAGSSSIVATELCPKCSSRRGISSSTMHPVSTGSWKGVVVQVASRCSKAVDIGKEEFPPSWAEFLLPPRNLHGDPLYLKDGALVELFKPILTRRTKVVQEPPGMRAKRLVPGHFFCQTGCNRLALAETYLSHKAWLSRAQAEWNQQWCEQEGHGAKKQAK
jgi:hypothetical protein